MTFIKSILLIVIFLPTVAFTRDYGTWPYRDVPRDHDNSRAIEYLKQEGIMSGYPDGSFGPDSMVNRAELMKILVESVVGTPDGAYDRSCFPDVKKEDWFSIYVCTAADRGWVQGYPDGKFRPERTVNMVEALKMIVKAHEYPLVAVESNPDGYDRNAWYAQFVATALDRRLVASETIWGYDGEKIDSPLSRKRIAEFLYRSLLADAKLSFSLESGCDVQKVKKVQLEWYNLKKYGSTATLDFDLRGIYDDGTLCMIGTHANPYGDVSPHFYSQLLFLQDAPEGYSQVQTAVVKDGKVSLTGGHETAGLGPDKWELDLASSRLHQISVSSPSN